MTPVKKVRPATDEDKVIGRGRPKWKQTADEVIDLLEAGEKAVVEFKLNEGERTGSVQSSIISLLRRRGYPVSVQRVEPKDEQPENEINFRISRKESK